MLSPSPLSARARTIKGLRIDNLDGTVLGTIINAKAEKLAHFAPQTLSAQSIFAENHRSLKRALQGKGRHFILECKRASPSLGDINLDLDLNALIRTYNRYASAISVLTEERFFKGSYDFLRQVRSQTDLPILLKDFIIDELELENARAIGADAVLLMTSVLTPDRFMELYHQAYTLGLEVLCEVSDAQEARFASQMGLEIVGINNRNLKSLTIDLNNASRLKDYFDSRTVLVSESGIKQHQDIVNLKGFSNFLIGSSVCGNSSNFDFAVKSLLFGMNKICGLKDGLSVKAAVNAKAAMGGLIFAPQSPRAVTIKQAKELMAADIEHVLRFCGVFLDTPLTEVIDIVQALKLDCLQLHGSEDPDYIARLQDNLGATVMIIKAFSVKDRSFITPLRLYQDKDIFFLFDSKHPGSGQSFDYTLLQDVDRNRSLLSGGLGIDNVEQALAQGFLGLDFNSRLEIAPGFKDPALVKAVFSQVNNY